MEIGTIAKVVEERGFGFIRPDGGIADVFFHAKSLGDGLVWGEQLKGQRVEFQTEVRDGRIRAAVVVAASN
jgi:cold shock CspA family protein